MGDQSAIKQINRKSKWLTFLPYQPALESSRAYRPTRRTLVWLVVAKASGGILGEIRWYGPWRQYAFFPEPNTVFAGSCFADIAEFCKAAHHMRAA